MSNVISFTGTIGRDAEVRVTAGGMSVLNVAVANNVGFGDKQKTNWFRVALFGKRAEGQLSTYLVKGQQVFVSGELTQSEYEKDGQTKITLEINANIIDLVGKRSDDGNQSAPSARQQPPPVQQRPTTQPAKPPYDDFDDSIPF